jgi:hypothetical protein
MQMTSVVLCFIALHCRSTNDARCNETQHNQRRALWNTQNNTQDESQSRSGAQTKELRTFHVKCEILHAITIFLSSFHSE